MSSEKAGQPVSPIVELTADIVSAYVSHNSVARSELPALLQEVHGALMQLENGDVTGEANTPKPAVPARKSVFNDYIVCLEDGKQFKSLKRHLRTQYGMTPEEYREKWGLPADYPMVAPNYARERSRLARQMGLGRQNTRQR